MKTNHAFTGSNMCVFACVRACGESNCAQTTDDVVTCVVVAPGSAAVRQDRVRVVRKQTCFLKAKTCKTFIDYDCTSRNSNSVTVNLLITADKESAANRCRGGQSYKRWRHNTEPR